jgi:hypothetical protein
MDHRALHVSPDGQTDAPTASRARIRMARCAGLAIHIESAAGYDLTPAQHCIAPPDDPGS